MSGVASLMAGGGNGPGIPEAVARRVRPMTEGDVPHIMALYGRVFAAGRGAAPGPAQEHLRQILCRGRWGDEALPSLVYEDEGGRIAGCLGVMPRWMQMHGRPIRVAVSHTFMVDPGSRSSLAALALARVFLAGNQDLSIAEGGGPSRRILERLGGAMSIPYSLRWTRPLRPGRYLLSFLRRRGLPAVVSAALMPLCAVADAAAPAILGRSARPPRSLLEGRVLTTGELLDRLSGVPAGPALRPRYDAAFLTWFLDLLAARKERGRFQRVAVVDAMGEVVGWYLYYLNPGGISEVVQVGATRSSMDAVLDHLFDHARRGGAEAVSGQLDPSAFRAYAAKGCVFHHDGVSWFLFHSRDREIVAAIHRGDAFLTRLEGEWCIGL